jgi:hypothetical protein
MKGTSALIGEQERNAGAFRRATGLRRRGMGRNVPGDSHDGQAWHLET